MLMRRPSLVRGRGAGGWRVGSRSGVDGTPDGPRASASRDRSDSSPSKPGANAEVGPHPVDVHVGERLRLRRRALGISQSVAAKALDLTFQQLQKYERGVNRISASRLHGLALLLRTPIDWFFEGLPNPVDAGAETEPAQARAGAAQAFCLSPDGLELAEGFLALSRPARALVLELVHAMAEDRAACIDEPTLLADPSAARSDIKA